MKVEIVTPKILHSPCDNTRNASSQVVQKNWKTYQTMDVTTGDEGSGSLDELQAGTSYVYSRGADTQRPTSLYAHTRNITKGEFDHNSAYWCGSDKKMGSTVVKYGISGLTTGQGQLVTSDGGARQSNDADLGPDGVLSKAGKIATGGVGDGPTYFKLIR